MVSCHFGSRGRGGGKFLPLELACYDLSLFGQVLKARAWAEGEGGFWHQQWCLPTSLTAWAAASQVPLAMVAGLRMLGIAGNWVC